MLGIFLDTETNGLDPFIHTPLEISLVIKNLITGEKVDAYDSLLIPTEEEWKNSNQESLSYTDISIELLTQSGKEKKHVAEEIIAFFQKNNIQRGNSVFICQNPSFDRAFFSKIIDVYTQEDLNLPYHWLDLASMYLCSRLMKSKLDYTLPLSKDAIAKHYNLPEEEKPHRAKNGVNHLITCYDAVVGS